MTEKLLLMTKKTKSPFRGNVEWLTLGSDFSLFHSISGAARSILRTAKVTKLYDPLTNHYSMLLTIVNNPKQNKKRLTLGLDFNISRRLSAEARSLSEWPGSPGFTIPLNLIVA